MLCDLTIKNFAIIDDVRIEFDKGFSVLTGETGAGKSIIIEAVNLLLGARASADLVRSGCEEAELEVFFDIDEGSHPAEVLTEQGLDASEGLMIRRLISAGGKSQVYVNSKRATLDLLRQVTHNLAGVSSQHAHQGLLKEENHLDILDEAAGTGAMREEVRNLYHSIVPLKNEVRELGRVLAENKKEKDLLEFQVNEILDAGLQPGEDELIEKKRKSLLNAARIFETVNGAVHEINDRDGALVERLSLLRQSLEKYDDFDERLESISGRFSSVLFELQDIVNDLRDFSSSIDLDPASLDAADQRMDTISKLKRKYGPTLEEVFDTCSTMEEKLFDTTQIEARIKICEDEIKALTEKIREKADALTDARKKAAEILASKAGEQLAALEMEAARFEVSFKRSPAKDPEDIQSIQGHKISADGQDRVGFLLSPNPGEEMKPLAKIASGGELSRIVLALKVVLSKNQSLETLIFDEVDAGIGGATSEKVGLKLKQLAEKHQVICITHLAQIAKYGTSQYRISKAVNNGRTYTSIAPLTGAEDRVREIARMIGGADITPATLTHARELLARADA